MVVEVASSFIAVASFNSGLQVPTFYSPHAMNVYYNVYYSP